MVESVHGRIDILINNSGINNQNPALATSIVERVAVNVAGPALVTDSFLPLLRKASQPRIIFISSVLGSLASRSDPVDPFFQLQAPGYRASKAALNMLMVCYHTQLMNDDITVHGVCPGFLATDHSGPVQVMRQMGASEPEVGAEVVNRVVVGEWDEEAGRVISANGVVSW